jgi:hypothetical protein
MKRSLVYGGKGREKEVNGIAMRQVTLTLICKCFWWYLTTNSMSVRNSGWIFCWTICSVHFHRQKIPYALRIFLYLFPVQLPWSLLMVGLSSYSIFSHTQSVGAARSQLVQWLTSGLDDRGIEVRFSVTTRDIYVFPPHPDWLWDMTCFLLNGYSGFSPWRGWGGVESHHSLPICTEVKHEWSWTSSTPYSVTVCTKITTILSQQMNSHEVLDPNDGESLDSGRQQCDTW